MAKRQRGKVKVPNFLVFYNIELTFLSIFIDINILQGNGSCDTTFGPGIIESPLKLKSSNKMPTPGGPLTEERIKELGVIKMNDYLSNGTRPQFWEEYFVKVIMHVSFSHTNCVHVTINSNLALLNLYLNPNSTL